MVTIYDYEQCKRRDRKWFSSFPNACFLTERRLFFNVWPYLEIKKRMLWMFQDEVFLMWIASYVGLWAFNLQNINIFSRSLSVAHICTAVILGVTPTMQEQAALASFFPFKLPLYLDSRQIDFIVQLHNSEETNYSCRWLFNSRTWNCPWKSRDRKIGDITFILTHATDWWITLLNIQKSLSLDSLGGAPPYGWRCVTSAADVLISTPKN